MADGAMDSATLDAYAAAQARLEHAGGYNWREARQRDAARARVPRRAPGPLAGDVLRRRADARVAGPRAGRRPRPAAARRAHEPPRHRVAGVAGGAPAVARRRRRAGRARPLVPGGRRHVGARARGRARAKFFKGTWHAWRAEKAQRELALGRAIEKQQAEIAKLERFVDRFRAGTRAKQAQSRAKKLEKIERLTRDPKDGKSLGFAFKPPERSGRVVFEVEDGELKIGSRVLLRDAELWLERAEHVSLVGANGSGKTTLITALTGGREFDGGKLRRGHNVKLGLLAQHADDLLGATGTVVEACQRATRLTPNNARALLGRFLFSGEEAEKPLDGLSRRRAPAAVAGDPRPLRRQRPDPRRADQPSRPREPRGAGGRAAALPGRAAADLPRPRAARRRRHAHGRRRGPDAALLRGRLARVRARARGARGGRADGEARQARASSRPRRRRSRRPKPRSKNEQSRARRSSRPRSRRPRRRWRRWRSNSPTRAPGTTRARRRSRPPATRRPSAPWRTSTRAGRPSPADRDGG